MFRLEHDCAEDDAAFHSPSFAALFGRDRVSVWASKAQPWHRWRQCVLNVQPDIEL